MRRRPAVMLLLITTLLAASCGSDDGPTAAPTTIPVGEASTTTPLLTTTVPAATSAAPPTTALAEMTAKAKAATLQQSDFPAGFEPVTEADGGGLKIEALWEELTGCLGVPKGPSGGTGISPTYLRGLATQAVSTVEYTTESRATAIAEAIAGPKFQQCADTAFAADVKRSAPEGGVPGKVQVVASKAPPVAPKSSRFRITVTINMSELKVPLFQDFFVIYSGGTVIRALFLNPGSEFPQDLQRSVLEKVISRA